jgi:hypothetical protein
MQGGTVSVTVDPNGQPQFVGAGLALLWAQATVGALLPILPALPALGATSPPYRAERPATQGDRDHSIAARRTLFEDKARDANAIAPVLVAYLQANASVVLQGVTATVAVSLGQTPSPNNPATPIAPPSPAVSLPLSGTGTLQ